jgi:hypothetical protein
MKNNRLITSQLKTLAYRLLCIALPVFFISCEKDPKGPEILINSSNEDQFVYLKKGERFPFQLTANKGDEDDQLNVMRMMVKYDNDPVIYPNTIQLYDTLYGGDRNKYEYWWSLLARNVEGKEDYIFSFKSQKGVWADRKITLFVQ